MALFYQTLDKLLSTIQTVLEDDLQDILDLDNTEMGWNLVAPKAYYRGQSAKIGHTHMPALLLWANLEAIKPGAESRGDHVVQVVFSLAIGQRDVKSGATNSDLYDAIVRYGSRIMLALMNDVTAIDPASQLRNVGVWLMQDGVSFFQPANSGTVQNSQYLTAKFTAKFTQRRAQTTS